MNAIKKRMIAEARRKYRRIFPCSYRRNLDDCFTVENNEIIFLTLMLTEPTHREKRLIPKRMLPKVTVQISHLTAFSLISHSTSKRGCNIFAISFTPLTKVTGVGLQIPYESRI